MCSTIFWLSMLCCSKTCFVREKSKQFNNFSSICSKTFLLPRLCSLCCSELFLPRQKKALEQHNLDNRKSFRTLRPSRRKLLRCGVLVVCGGHLHRMLGWTPEQAPSRFNILFNWIASYNKTKNESLAHYFFKLYRPEGRDKRFRALW